MGFSRRSDGPLRPGESRAIYDVEGMAGCCPACGRRWRQLRNEDGEIVEYVVMDATCDECVAEGRERPFPVP